MKALPATRTKIVDKQGRVLQQETVRYEFEGDQPIEVIEVLIGTCPSCGSRLDQASIVGICAECETPVCTNCASRCQCKKAFCDKHKHFALLGNEKLVVCSECAPIVEEQQRREARIQDEELARRAREKEVELGIRVTETRIKELNAVHDRVLGTRKQAQSEAEARFNAQVTCQRLRMESLRTYAPTAYHLLQSGAGSHQSRQRRQ